MGTATPPWHNVPLIQQVFFFNQTTSGHRITGYLLVSRPGVWKATLSGMFNSLVFHRNDFTRSENCMFHHPTAACKSQRERKLFSSLMDKISLSWRISLHNTKQQNMLSFPFLDFFFTWKGLLALPHIMGRGKKEKRKAKRKKIPQDQR